jgi:hypothetical protein
MKLSALKEVQSLAATRTRTIKVRHDLQWSNGQLEATNLYTEAEGRYDLLDVTGREWMRKVIVARCDELIEGINARLKSLGVRVDNPPRPKK